MRLRVFVSLIWFGQMRFFGIIFTGIIPLLPKVENRIWSILLLDSHTVSFLGRHRTIVHDSLTFLCVVTQMPWREGRRGGGHFTMGPYCRSFRWWWSRSVVQYVVDTPFFLSADAQRLTEHTSSSNIPPLDRFVSRSSRPLFFFFLEGETFLLSWS